MSQDRRLEPTVGDPRRSKAVVQRLMNTHLGRADLARVMVFFANRQPTLMVEALDLVDADRAAAAGREREKVMRAARRRKSARGS